jgi:transposase-like protein
MTYAEMRAAQFEVCHNWLKQYADEGVWLSEVARRTGIDKGTINRIAKKHGLIFSGPPKKIRQRRKSRAKPATTPAKAELRQAEASLKAQLSHHTKRLLNAGYKTEAAKMEAFRTVKALIALDTTRNPVAR